MTTVEDLEIRRRSIAMLPPGSPAIAREDALVLLAELAELRRYVDDSASHAGPPSAASRPAGQSDDESRQTRDRHPAGGRS